MYRGGDVGGLKGQERLCILLSPFPTKGFQQISCPLVSSWRTDRHRAPGTGPWQCPYLIPQSSCHRALPVPKPQLNAISNSSGEGQCELAGPPEHPWGSNSPPSIPMPGTVSPPVTVPQSLKPDLPHRQIARAVFLERGQEEEAESICGGHCPEYNSS